MRPVYRPSLLASWTKSGTNPRMNLPNPSWRIASGAPPSDSGGSSKLPLFCVTNRSSKWRERVGRESWGMRISPMLLRVDDDLVPMGGSHGFYRLVDLRQGETVRDYFIGIHQVSRHEADGVLHSEWICTEASVHAGLEKVHPAAVELELLMRRNPKQVPARAAA